VQESARNSCEKFRIRPQNENEMTKRQVYSNNYMISATRANMPNQLTSLLTDHIHQQQTPTKVNHLGPIRLVEKP